MTNAMLLGALLLHKVLGSWGQALVRDHNCTYQDVYMPVCGSDGKDYFNYELLECVALQNPRKNLSAKYMYPCSCHQVLDSKKISPVCATGKHTYPTKEAFQCTKVLVKDSKMSILAKGVCKGGKLDVCWANMLPPILWSPVCGTDELTYNSIWHLRCENLHSGNNISVNRKGPCPCKVSRLFKPLCASNQITYPNVETFECDKHIYSLHNVSIIREGYCDWSEDSSCEDRVPQFDEGICNGLCASDGITYLTAQQFKCVRNKTKDLKLLHDGPCKISEIPKTITSQKACEIENKYPVVAPVCGTDGVSYMSLFSLLCRSYNQTGLKLLSEGVCEKDKEQPPIPPCTVKDERIFKQCGTNNVTYKNPTHFACAASKIKGLMVLHPGECKSAERICQAANDTATMTLPCVCASDGQTYINSYAFWCKKLDCPDIKVEHYDECV